MELYKTVAYTLTKHLTELYSTSFSMSSRLFDASIRPHVYAIYGLVRIADEIVDSFMGDDDTKLCMLDALEKETYEAIKRGYSPNPIVHAFALTAADYGIDANLITPFFTSMRMDIGSRYTSERYEEYIYGSAEVVGLMCLAVFCGDNNKQYSALELAARKLGAAYQKVNFLRDFASDYRELGRVYFPSVTFDSFTEAQKKSIEKDCRADFEAALPYIKKLPHNAKNAVYASYLYYSELLIKISQTPVEVLKTKRIRVSTPRKLWLYSKLHVKARQ